MRPTWVPVAARWLTERGGAAQVVVQRWSTEREAFEDVATAFGPTDNVNYGTVHSGGRAQADAGVRACGGGLIVGRHP
jgi:hypothetical protein